MVSRLKPAPTSKSPSDTLGSDTHGFDGSAEPAQNQFMRAARDAGVALVVVLALFSTVFVSVCGGWESSARARMACCAGADHQGTRAEADNCCAAGEQRRHSESAAPMLAVAPPQASAVLLAASLVQAPMGRVLQDPLDRTFRSTDTHVLLSVLLI